MLRNVREKTKEAIFYIMARSMSEIDLFKDKDDKLSSIGIRLVDEERYSGIVEEFMNYYAA